MCAPSTTQRCDINVRKVWWKNFISQLPKAVAQVSELCCRRSTSFRALKICFLELQSKSLLTCQLDYEY